MVYYNEIDPFAGAWLEELMNAGVIARGIVDARPIQEVSPDELTPFTQCHFFAGIGVWAYALRQAGWPDDRPVWTGSCPCQPFSAAGRGKGFADDRHLWPAWFDRIAFCHPPVIFGEQVASKAGRGWIDLVSADVEDEGYAFGAADLAAAGVGAPHIRQRHYWVADTPNERSDRGRASESGAGRDTPRIEPERLCDVGGMGDSFGERDAHTGRSDVAGPPTRLQDPDGQRERIRADAREPNDPSHTTSSGLAHSNGRLTSDRLVQRSGRHLQRPENAATSFWSDADWLYCRDSKYRPVEPGTFPLVTGAPARVGRLRGYGNALCAPVATAFIQAYLDCGR